MRRVHSWPLRLARSAPMHRTGLTHTPDLPAELVHVFGVEVEGDRGKDEEDEEEEEEEDEEEDEEEEEEEEGEEYSEEEYSEEEE